jgi:hypothetical protein
MTLPDLSIRNAQYCCMGCCSQIAPIDPDRTNCCSRGSAIACLRNYRSNLPEYDHPKSLFIRQQNRIWLIDVASFRIFPGPRCATAIQRSRRRQRFPFCRERRQSSCYQRFRPLGSTKAECRVFFIIDGSKRTRRGGGSSAQYPAFNQVAACLVNFGST